MRYQKNSINFFLKTVFMLTLFITLASIKFPNIVQAADFGSRLNSGYYFNPGDYLTSASGVYRAVLQYDGNFVVYNTTNWTPIWNTETNASDTRMQLQPDGNFVLYRNISTSPVPIWNSETIFDSIFSPYYVEMRDDGNLVLYDKYNHWTWSSFNNKNPLMEYGWPRSGSITSVPIKSYSYNDSWQPAMDQALANWNNSPARIVFNKTDPCVNTVTAAQYSTTDYGVNIGYFSGSTLNHFDIQLNSRTISNDAVNFSNFVQSVFVHELGHSIWLQDNPSTSSSIMLYSRDRNTLTNPTGYDINNVNQKY